MSYTLDDNMYCEIWQLENGKYYYFGYYDKDGTDTILPGNFDVEVVSAGYTPVGSMNLTGGKAATQLP